MRDRAASRRDLDANPQADLAANVVRNNVHVTDVS
jgi:hypothetical protein